MQLKDFVVRAAILATCVALFSGPRHASADSYAGNYVTLSFDPPKAIPSHDPHVDYTIDPTVERFFAYVPRQYTDNAGYGLFVFISADSATTNLPTGWIGFLEKRKLIFISPNNAGENVADSRRLGLAIFAALGAEGRWKIDPKRIYAAGFSGGAQIAGKLGFCAPDIFAGSVQICGADFYQKISPIDAKTLPQTQTSPGAGLSDITPDEIAAAKKTFRFAFITGEKDPRGAQIRDIANSGYSPNNFHSTLIDVPGMGHELCSPKWLGQAIDFIENIAPTTQPAPPKWMVKDHALWPQILLTNKVVDRQNGTELLGSGSLVRLPGGVVVEPTAGHLLDGIALKDFATSFKSWSAQPWRSDSGGIAMTRIAMDATNPPKLDALVLCPEAQRIEWPVMVLPVRTQPLEVGDTIYLVAVPHGDTSSRQNVYKGTIVDTIDDDHELIYEIDTSFATTGCSGAPILDDSGQLAAINVGHLNNQDIPGKLHLTCIDATEVLKVIKLPPDVRAAPAPSATPASELTGAGDNANQRVGDKSEQALHIAQTYIDNKMYGPAKRRLQAIIDAYPNTAAAKQAAELLPTLPDE
jgi:predicted esterase